MTNWICPSDSDETPTLNEIKKAIVERALSEAPYIENVPVHKSETLIQTIARKAANEELTSDEEALMLEVFRGAFQLTED